MPAPGSAPTRLGFLTTGPFDPADPAVGLEEALRLVEARRRARPRHRVAPARPPPPRDLLPVAMLAAASQRTRRIGLGTASIPVRAENPLRLAEDLATVDLLSGGRLRPGLSVGSPKRVAAVDRAVHPTTAEHEEPGRERLLRFRDLLRGGRVPGADERPDGSDDEHDDDALTPTVQPASPGLADRLGYGAATLRTAAWAGSHGFRLLASDVTERASGAGGRGFAADQRDLIDAYRAAHPDPAAAHVTLALVVVPTDGATAEQRARYAADAAARAERARRTDQSEDAAAASSMVRAPDLVGPSDEAHRRAPRAPGGAGRRRVLAIALPAGLPAGDLARILTDVAERLGPALGWAPATA
ncbi:LLM class flavin-dependent oxidoreductase [Clavibacter tessellarius]|uniref:LLM class flavin-dependent oxidoreductase n=1 Tax=Clavibacter tessellarius TaxID=31965 RepID=UPI0032515F5F